MALCVLRRGYIIICQWRKAISGHIGSPTSQPLWTYLGHLPTLLKNRLRPTLLTTFLGAVFHSFDPVYSVRTGIDIASQDGEFDDVLHQPCRYWLIEEKQTYLRSPQKMSAFAIISRPTFRTACLDSLYSLPLHIQRLKNHPLAHHHLRVTQCSGTFPPPCSHASLDSQTNTSNDTMDLDQSPTLLPPQPTPASRGLRRQSQQAMAPASVLPPIATKRFIHASSDVPTRMSTKRRNRRTSRMHRTHILELLVQRYRRSRPEFCDPQSHQ